MMRRPEPELMDVPDRAQAYADADFRDVNEAFVARFVELAGQQREGRLLDVGTGPGDIAVLVAEALPGWRVIALDGSLAMLRIGRARTGGRVRFVLADAKRSAFCNGAFDAVYASSILHHVADPLAFWLELRRVCRAGGLIHVRDLFRPPDEAGARRIVEEHAGDESAILREDFYHSLLAAYTPDEVRVQLWEAGLTGFTVKVITDRHMDIWGWV